MARDPNHGWQVARPSRPLRLPGVTMAGFAVPGFPAPLSLVPHPALTLVVEFGAGRPIVGDAHGVREQGSLVAGLGFGLGGVVTAHGDNVACLQVRIAPVVAGALLGASPAELAGTMVNLDDLWGRASERLREQLAEQSDWPARFVIMEDYLTRRAATAPRVDPETARAWDRIVAGRGLVRIDPLAAEVGWSRKRLWSRFRSQLGVQPKLAAKLIKFDHAVHRLVAGADPALVAADTGYFDQSHLHRDVLAITGVTPGRVINEPFLTIDEVAWPRRAGER